MNFKPATQFESSSLQGYIEISYAELVEVFSMHHHEGDGYKIDAEWDLKFEDGTHATIYNYKDGKNYNGQDGDAVENITNWHIGGNTHKSVEAVYAVINTKLNTNKTIKEVYPLWA